MHQNPYSDLIYYKQWADRGLYEVVSQNFDRLDGREGEILVRILDHIHVVDRVFQAHLQGRTHAFQAARSQTLPDVRTLAEGTKSVDDWYASYVGKLSKDDVDQPVDFVFTNGTPGHMTRGEILMHVGLHGTYHRGNAGLLLQRNGIKPNDDRMTDFLEAANESGIH